jgi:hypothetical protein
MVMENGSIIAAVIAGIIGGLIGLALAIFMIVAMWKLLSKARQPGWAIFIPIYNIIVLLRVAGKPWWWLFLLWVPLLNIVIEILIWAGIATNYGKGGGFTVGLIFLPIIFVPILAFGDATWQGPVTR